MTGKNRSLVESIAGRLSLRPPQRRSLEILDRITELAPITKGADLAEALATIRAEFPGVTDFERDFPSYGFALATGVGKTRLMGGFITYLHQAHGLNNFFVLAPNLTIYDKLIGDFSQHTPKYVFRGIAEFAAQPPIITTGDNYERQIMRGASLLPVTINIFNISKINAEVRGGRGARIRNFREEIGESYFDHLARLTDLVLIMDESHRYRASAGVRAINELNPAIGIELTATPFSEGRAGPARFKNIVFEYPLARAIADGFVKDPAVVTRENFIAAGKTPEVIERFKIEDGIRLHEKVKTELETYAAENGVHIVKPFVLIIARDTRHAAELMRLVRSTEFFDGRYADRVIQVDSSMREEETIGRLLRVERTDEPTEIVIHVNMLKEGWDVSNLYTIVPLRAANARTLIEQSIGRGLRLPYGRRTGVVAVDRLNIVAHDRFQEIVDETRRPDSPIRMTEVVLGDRPDDKTEPVMSRPRLASILGVPSSGGVFGIHDDPPIFTPAEQAVAVSTYEAIRGLEARPDLAPGTASLRRPDVLAELVRIVEGRHQASAPGPTSRPDIVARTVETVAAMTIDIPRILARPRAKADSGFTPVQLDLSGMNYAPGETLWAAHLRTDAVDRISIGTGKTSDESLEDMLVAALIGFDDVSYDNHADALYDLAGQVARHLRSTLSEDDARQTMRFHLHDIAAAVHRQMQAGFWRSADAEPEIVVTRGFSELRQSVFSCPLGEPPLDYRTPVSDGSQIARHVYGGFARCLYPLQKFQSEAERRLSVILERESQKWFKPALGQLQLFYINGREQLEYQPDFVAETADRLLLIEVKAADQMNAADVLAKRRAALQWCERATIHTSSHGGKPWTYLLIPHDSIFENMTLDGLARRHAG